MDTMPSQEDAVRDEVKAAVEDVDMEEQQWSESDNGDEKVQVTEPEKEIGIPSIVVKEESKPDMKLEDLFADMDSDDEFASSAVMRSSPPQPSSPVYANS